MAETKDWKLGPSRGFPGGPVVKNLQGMQVQSPVGELRSHMPLSNEDPMQQNKINGKQTNKQKQPTNANKPHSLALKKNFPKLRLSLTYTYHSLEKEMTTHSNILAWRIPWTEEPGGSSDVGRDWGQEEKGAIEEGIHRAWTPSQACLC